jgi:serine/threonine protein kinase
MPRTLDDVAARLADGAAIDWDVLESSAPDEATRNLLRQLREIASISRAHALDALDCSLTDTRRDAGQIVGEPEDAPVTWGGLRILGEIGRGRFGTVYRAWDPALEREVALKLLRTPEVPPASSEAGSPDEALVVHEGRLMARVRHPNVVTIYGAQRIAGRTGIWMELVEGQTLEAELEARGPFAPLEVAAVGIELCRALAAVHAAGLVHRDVKAQNVLRDVTGRIALGDFGTGREADDLERERGLAGTPAPPGADRLGMAGAVSASTGSVADRQSSAAGPADPCRSDRGSGAGARGHSDQHSTYGRFPNDLHSGVGRRRPPARRRCSGRCGAGARSRVVGDGLDTSGTGGR